MYDEKLVAELASQILDAINRVERRFADIDVPDDFLKNDENQDRLDAIAMMFIAIGENIKRIDKITAGVVLGRYPAIHWPGVKGVRDILAHDYFNIDPDEIFAICKKDLVPLKDAVAKIKTEHE